MVKRQLGMLDNIAPLFPALAAVLNLVRVVRLLSGLKSKTRRRRTRSSRSVIKLGWLKYVRKESFRGRWGRTPRLIRSPGVLA